MLTLKKLVVFNADVSCMNWYREGKPAPVPASGGDAAFRWLERSEWERDASILDTPANVVASRYDEGGRCLVGTAQDRTIYHLWLMPAGTFVAWIGTAIRPPERGMLVTDVWVHPAHRGRSVHRFGAALAVRELVRLERTIVTAGVEEHEFFPMAALYARLGLGICVPDYRLYWLDVGGRASFHWRGRPSSKSRRFAQGLAEAYGGSAQAGRNA